MCGSGVFPWTQRPLPGEGPVTPSNKSGKDECNKESHKDQLQSVMTDVNRDTEDTQHMSLYCRDRKGRQEYVQNGEKNSTNTITQKEIKIFFTNTVDYGCI